MHVDLSELITATAQWLTRAYPSRGAFSSALSEVQARQAVTVAAWLRYPTAMDAALVTMAGPGGSARLDRVTGGFGAQDPHPWCSWVDEVVASWAACLLAGPSLAEAAVAALAGGEHMSDGAAGFRRLVSPDAHDLEAAALLRHPDLLQPISALHRDGLLDRLGQDFTLAH
ncbi:hypothetical protein [Streptomyces sp. B1I3]|uniref:hypothetical protein n=1 Tax=Streptomyces sp. B1I3 TaxID=3042264 RepID=UPI0027D7BFE0|nr:hypothetical protein [Streptomyces sp. B1I3]